MRQALELALRQLKTMQKVLLKVNMDKSAIALQETIEHIENVLKNATVAQG